MTISIEARVKRYKAYHRKKLHGRTKCKNCGVTGFLYLTNRNFVVCANCACRYKPRN